MRWLLILALVAASPGCSALFSTEVQVEAHDAAPGAADAFDAMGCDATSTLYLHEPGLYTLSTDTGILEGPRDLMLTLPNCHPDSSAFEILLGEFTLGDDLGGSMAELSRLRVTGDKPLIIGVTGTLTIASDGGIDVSSSRGMPVGAGASSAMCNAAQAEAIDMVGAGGSGGSFQGQGGAGGTADDGAVSGTTPPDGLPPPNNLRAGCPGGDGGAASGSSDGIGGPGGGALKLQAAEIVIRGFVNAGGGGGEGGVGSDFETIVHGGGGGGGSGGTIWLEAPMVSITERGALFAKGGGGGAGGDSCRSGKPGEGALEAQANVAAGGGVVASCLYPAGAGGSGSWVDTDGTSKGGTAGDPGSMGATGILGAGGGGGGGSPGYILIDAETSFTIGVETKFSPPFTTV